MARKDDEDDLDLDHWVTIEDALDTHIGLLRDLDEEWNEDLDRARAARSKVREKIAKLQKTT